MACTVVGDLCKRSDERKFRGVDLTSFCSRYWLAGGIFSNGTRIRPMAKADGGARGITGFEYEAQTDGQAGEKEPKWPIIIGQSVIDGSLTWQCVALSNASLERSIPSSANVTWVAPTGYTADPGPFQNTGGKQLTGAFIGGGADGDEDQLVIAHVIFDDTTEEDFAISVMVHDDGTDDTV